MATLETIAAKTAEVGKKSADYTFRDGIAVCNICGEPRQTKKDFGTGERLVWCTCSCMNETIPAVSRERIESLQTRGGVNPLHTFESAQYSREIEICRRYAARWIEAAKNGAGLLLWGDVGTGKTFAAHAIANELIKQDIPVFITSLARVINSGFDRDDILKRLNTASLVVFDDLGAERSSQYALEAVYLLVDERYRTGKPMIITTNLTDKEFLGALDVDRKRIYDRVLERCVPLRFGGNSKREERAAQMRKFMRDLMEGARSADDEKTG